MFRPRGYVYVGISRTESWRLETNGCYTWFGEFECDKVGQRWMVRSSLWFEARASVPHLSPPPPARENANLQHSSQKSVAPALQFEPCEWGKNQGIAQSICTCSQDAQIRLQGELQWRTVSKTLSQEKILGADSKQTNISLLVGRFWLVS